MELINVKVGSAYIFKTEAELADAAASEFVKLAKAAINERGRFVVALSGGSTPKLLYARLLADEYRLAIAWDKVHFFVSDERSVPLDSSESNFGNAQRLFLQHLTIPPANLHSMKKQDSDPQESALEYEGEIHHFFKGDRPIFDLILLGMGPDGHTASLFPGTRALDEHERLVTDNFVEKLHTTRITFTFALINQARNVVFLIQNGEKSEVLAQALQSDQILYPVQRVNPQNGNVYWLLDESAAAELHRAAPLH